MQVPRRKSEQSKIRLQFDPYLSKNKYNQLVDSLKDLKKSQPQLASEVKRLASDGDFSENAGYQLAKSQLRTLNSKVLFLEKQLKYAIIIDDNIINENSKQKKIQIGSQVTLEKQDKIKEYTILGSSESDPSSGIISHLSPLGSLLIGKKIGDKVALNTENKKIQSYTIKQIN